MEFIIIIVILIIALSFAAKTGEKVKDRFDIDSKIIYLEEKRDIMTVEEKREYIIKINDYRNKLSSSKLTSPIWLTRVSAKSDLENSCRIIEEFYNKIKASYGD